MRALFCAVFRTFERTFVCADSDAYHFGAAQRYGDTNFDTDFSSVSARCDTMAGLFGTHFTRCISVP